MSRTRPSFFGKMPFWLRRLHPPGCIFIFFYFNYLRKYYPDAADQRTRWKDPYRPVTNYNQIITTDLQTTATLVDVSVIYPYNYAPGQAQYIVNTYKSVNLTAWKDIPMSDSVPGAVYPIANGNATLALNNDNLDYQSYMTKEANVAAANQRPLSNQAMLNVNVNPQGGSFSTRLFKLRSITAKQ